MNINKAEPPEDQREISLNETSLKRPLDVVDVIGGHGPWQFRQWIVFFAASLCNSLILFSALFLPSQTFCFLANSTVLVDDQIQANGTTLLLDVRSYVASNASAQTLPAACNSTDCEVPSNSSETDVSLSKFLYPGECWNSQVDILAKCVFIFACVLSGVLVYFSTSRFGRRPVALASCVFLMASSVATSWVDSTAVFLIMRFIISLGIVNIYFISVFSLMEYVYKEYKILYFMTGHIGWGLAHFLLPAIAWLAEDWKSFCLSLSIVCVLVSVSVWWGPDSPSLPSRGHLSRTRKALKYAAFTNGYSTTDVDAMSHSLHMRQENKHDLGTPLSLRKKILWILYSCLLFLMSFITAFFYFATKWHTEWFKVDSNRISFAFLGSTEVASAIILLFLTCLVSIKYLWALVSVMASALMITIYARTSNGSSTSSAMLYTVTVFFAASGWTLVLAKSFCHKIYNTTSKLNLIVISAAVFAGAVVASSVVLKDSNQDLLLVVAVPYLIVAAATVIIPDDYFGTIL